MTFCQIHGRPDMFLFLLNVVISVSSPPPTESYAYKPSVGHCANCFTGFHVGQCTTSKGQTIQGNTFWQSLYKVS